MSAEFCGAAVGLLLDIDFVNELQILPTVHRSGRSELLIFKKRIAQKLCSTAHSGKTNYLAYPALHSNGHSKKCNYGVSALADVLKLFHGERVSNGGAVSSDAV